MYNQNELFSLLRRIMSENSFFGLKLHNLLMTGHIILAVILVLWLNQGIFEFIQDFIPGIMRWGIFIIWISMSFLLDINYHKRFIKFQWPLLIFFVLIIFISVYANNLLIDFLKTFLYLIMITSIFLFYFEHKNSKIRKLLIMLILLDLFIVGINTYINLQINPLLARYLSQGMDVQKAILGIELIPV